MFDWNNVIEHLDVLDADKNCLRTIEEDSNPNNVNASQVARLYTNSKNSIGLYKKHGVKLSTGQKL